MQNTTEPDPIPLIKGRQLVGRCHHCGGRVIRIKNPKMDEPTSGYCDGCGRDEEEITSDVRKDLEVLNGILDEDWPEEGATG